MAVVLIVYGTSEGHTDLVVEHLRAPIEVAGHHVRACRVADAPTSPVGYDAVLVGSSVHVGRHHSGLVRWVRGNAERLQGLPSAFFQVCLASASGPSGESDARGYVDRLIADTGWKPALVGLFGGALRYREYGIVKRSMLKKIAGSSGLDTDVRRDYDYTDYAVVEAFGKEFLGLLPPEGSVVDVTVDAGVTGDAASSASR
jgi:menaquinone-dependent protoporphyrinogen oxidase